MEAEVHVHQGIISSREVDRSLKIDEVGVRTWSGIVRGLVSREPFAEPHIRQLGAAPLCQQHIMGLQISVNNSTLM